MSLDIGAILAGWDFQPDDLQVRLVAGDDGRDKIQMRVDLGVLQMECEGRPDGRRPHDRESLLDYYEARHDEAIAAGEDFTLLADDCAGLMREGLQYYHRYLAAFHLQLFDLVARDTERNLRLFAFVRRHAARNRDRIEFDQYRPYVAMMHARALGLKELGRGDRPAALARIEEGIRRIRDFLHDYQQDDCEGDCSELNFLLRWRDDLQVATPPGPVALLEDELRRAVDGEDYEEAARLRDRIRRLRGEEGSRQEAHG